MPLTIRITDANLAMLRQRASSWASPLSRSPASIPQHAIRV